MSYALLIVESPAKCSKIENYLGSGYKCVASFGHLRELNSLEAIDIKNNFKPTFVESESKLKQISKIRSLITKASEVLLASDDDREGEAIAWHICQIFGLPVKTTKRIIFHEITETALKNAVKNPTLINMDVVNAQIARQILDILVGYKLSPLLWKNIAKNTKTGLSAGRCQTPALRIVYENQKEIDASPGSKVYNTVGYFTSKNLPFALNFNHEGEEAITAFLEESVNHDHIYTCGKPRNTTKQPPAPFTTSGIQQMASNEMHISPKETMQICQKLYEAGHITYMRTDSNTYGEDFIKIASAFITSEYGKEYVNEKIEDLSLRADADADAKDKKTKSKKEKGKEENKPQAQEAHEAIRPTNIKLKTLNAADDFTSKELKMYLLIRRNTLESCMTPATYKGITAIVSSPVKEIEYRFSTEQVIFPGWKIVDGYDKLNNDYVYLQTLKSENKIEYKKITAKVTMKNIKSHYTEARLVQLLEQHGIGRPSTFSSLIDKIQERGYVKKDNVKGVTVNCVDFELEDEQLAEIETKREFGNEKNKLVLQPLGMLVLEFLLKHFDSLFDYTYTKNMEDTLDLIAKGEKIWNELCQECLTQIEELSANILPKAGAGSGAEELVGEIRIDNEHTYMIAKYGPVIKCTIKDTASRKDIISFKKLKPDIKIDINKLKNGEYQLSELVCENKLTGKMLGLYKDHEVILKNGKFGLYVEWGDLKKSIKLELTLEEIKLEDIISLLENNNDNKDGLIQSSSGLIQSSIVRVINDSLSIRSGKFGDYIFYKKKTMKQPKFLKLAGFEGNYKDGDLTVLKKWLKENYGV